MLKGITVLVRWTLMVLSLFSFAVHAQEFSLRPEDLLSGPFDLVRSGTPNTPCITPESQHGVCGNANTCRPYLHLLNDIHNKTVLEFFRKRICRQSSGVIHVCCPMQDHRQQHTTTTTTTTTTQGNPTTFISLQKPPGGFFFHRPSQRPNGRQPPRGGLRFQGDEDVEVEEVEEEDEFKSIILPLHPNQPNHFTLPPQPPPAPPPRQPQHPPSTTRPRISSLRPLPTTTTTTTPSTTSSTHAAIFILSPFPPNTPRPPLPPPPPPASTGVLMGPDRGPSLPPSPIQSPSETVKTNTAPPTEPPRPKVIPAEGVCGTMRQGSGPTQPWVVSIGNLDPSGFHVTCSGALVSTLHVIVAAHCLHTPIPTHVRLGDTGEQSNTPVDVSILSWIHPEYNPATRDNDLALITLTNPVTYTDNIQPVCLPFPYRFDGFQEQQVTLIGWGRGGRVEDGPVRIIGLGECKRAYKSPFPIENQRALFSDPTQPVTPAPSPPALINPRSGSGVVVDRRHLCGSPAPSTTSSTRCLSEHGAPLIYHDEYTTGLYYLVGVSSIGEGCRAGPGLYTRLGAFLPWLSDQLGLEEEAAHNLHPTPAPRRFPELTRRRG